MLRLLSIAAIASTALAHGESKNLWRMFTFLLSSHILEPILTCPSRQQRRSTLHRAKTSASAASSLSHIYLIKDASTSKELKVQEISSFWECLSIQQSPIGQELDLDPTPFDKVRDDMRRIERIRFHGISTLSFPVQLSPIVEISQFHHTTMSLPSLRLRQLTRPSSIDR